MPICHRCHFFELAFAWELTKETIHLPPGCLQGGFVQQVSAQPALSDTMHQSISFRKSTSPQNCQLNDEQKVDDCVGGLTFQS